MNISDPVKCPRCALNDQIRKVSTVVNEGTASRPSEYWTSGAIPTRYPDITSRTGLAERLSLPAPSNVSAGGVVSQIGCGVFVGIAGFLIGGFIIGIILSAMHVPDGGQTVFDLLMIAVLVAWIVAVVRKAAKEKRDSSWENKAYPALRRVWDDLYYCFRDDVVFRGSDSTKWAPTDEISELVRRESGLWP